MTLRTSRRALLAAVTLGPLAAACGRSNAPTPAGSAPAGSASPTSAVGGLLPPGEGVTPYPLQLVTPYGETSLTKRPERVAVVGGLGDTESVLVLGGRPIVATDPADGWDWLPPYAEQLGKALQVNAWDTLPIEKIAALKPDVIIAPGLPGLAQEFSKLSKVAPVAAFEQKLNLDDSDMWQDMTRLIGKTLDLGAAADRAIADTDHAVASMAEKHPEYRGKTLAIVINYGEENGLSFVNYAGTPTESLLTRLGFAPHPKAAEIAKMGGPDDAGNLSLENLPLINADAVVVARHGGQGSAQEAARWMEGSPLFKNLRPVKEGHAGFIDPDPKTKRLDVAWAFAHPDALNVRWLLTKLEATFQGLFS